MEKNLDPDTVASFGDEWSRHSQADLSESELTRMYDNYFDIFVCLFLNTFEQTTDVFAFI